jgi:FkbM family methyltransferase
MGLRRTLRKLLGYEEPEQYLNDSFAQEGEDLILSSLFNGRVTGFYIDIGAMHPTRFSNTYRFYKEGWRGINIDAMPGSMQIFDKIRPLDINLEIPVADQVQTIPYYIFNEPALNTLCRELAEARDGKDTYVLEKVVDIETQTLSAILEKHLPVNQKIDFLTIDAEGFDFQILQSNDWEKYQPAVVLIESDVSFPNLINSKLNIFMNEHGYEFFAKTVRTFFFKRKDFAI